MKSILNFLYIYRLYKYLDYRYRYNVYWDRHTYVCYVDLNDFIYFNATELP